jgi:hypothetical protein
MSELADEPETKLTARSGEWRRRASPTVPTTCLASITHRQRSGKQRSPIEIRGDVCAAARRSYLHATGSCFATERGRELGADADDCVSSRPVVSGDVVRALARLAERQRRYLERIAAGGPTSELVHVRLSSDRACRLGASRPNP